MPSFDHTFDAFPEGTWWIAWMDHVSSNSVHKRLVHVTLSHLAPHVGSATTLRLSPEKIVFVEMDVAGLPFFAVGDIVHNKRLVQVGNSASVRSVCDFAGGSTEIFAIEAAGIARRSGSRLADDRAARPAGNPGSRCPPVLSPFEYPFPATRNCECLSVADGDRTFLIPAAELLRSLVMPFSEPLGKLFDRSLTALVAEMVEQPFQASPLPGHFRMDLKEGYDGRHAPFIANLLDSYNPVGSQAAASIHASLSKADPLLRYRKTAVPEGASVLPCVFPFGTGTVAITAKCFVLVDGRFLVAKIIGGTWPPCVPLDVGLMRQVVDPDADPTVGGRKGGRRTSLRGGDPVHVDLQGTPGFGSDPTELAVEHLSWGNLPFVVLQVRTRRPVLSTPHPGPTGIRHSGTVAVGPPQPGGNLAPANATHAALPSVHRFDATLAALTRLKDAGDIVGFKLVLPHDHECGASRGGVQVWIWPDRKGWFVVKSTSHPDRPRSVLVVRIEVVAGRFVHWFTVEPDDKKSYGALLIVFGGDDAHDDVVKIVDELGNRYGSVSDPDGFARANSGLRGTSFRHSNKKLPKPKRSPSQQASSPAAQANSSASASPSTDTADPTPQPLNGKRVLEALHLVIGPR